MLAAALGLAALSAGALSAFSACRYDPVPQEIIDSLGEETGTPGPNHRPGQPCLTCHSTYEGATPAMAIGGTVYKQDDTGALVPAPRVLVVITDTSGDSRRSCSNAAGNFFIEKDDWDDVAYPLAVTAGDRKMRSIIGRDGSCGSCHKPPAEGQSGLGATLDSPGVVIVSADAIESTCPPVGGQ
jgi:hypothetical protein